MIGFVIQSSFSEMLCSQHGTNEDKVRRFAVNVCSEIAVKADLLWTLIYLESVIDA